MKQCGRYASEACSSLGARVPIDADARLRPVRLRLDRGRVGRDHPEIDLIPAGADLVLDHDAVVQSRPKLDPPAVGARLDKLRLVRDDRLFPIAPRRTGPAERLDVPDLERTAGQMLAVDRQDLLVPGQRQGPVGWGGRERHVRPRRARTGRSRSDCGTSVMDAGSTPSSFFTQSRRSRTCIGRGGRASAGAGPAAVPGNNRDSRNRASGSRKEPPRCRSGHRAHP